MYLKSVVYAIGLSALLLASACQGEHQSVYVDLDDPSVMDRKFTVQELREDTAYLFKRLHALHPDLDSRLSPADRAALEASVLAQIERPMTRREFYRLIGATTEHFRDGHAGVFYPYPEFDRFAATGAGVFPMTVTATADGLFVKKDYSAKDALPAGTRLLAINGIPVADMLREMSRYTRGETPVLREQIVADDFNKLLWHFHEFKDSFEVEYEAPGGVRKATVVGIRNEDFNDAVEEAEEAGGENVAYRSLGDGVGYLDVSYFGGDEGDFKRVVNKAVEAARKEKIRAIVVDLRRNPGGSTDNVEILLARLSSKECQLVSRIREKLNDKSGTGLFAKGKPGELIELDMDTTVSPASESKRFPGKVYVLIGPYTYSAAIVMATAVQDCGVGVLVGEETAGFGNQTGQIYFFNLPHTQIRAFAPTRIMLRPNGVEGSSPVVPDHLAPPTLETMRADRDAAIERAKALALDND